MSPSGIRTRTSGIMVNINVTPAVSYTGPFEIAGTTGTGAWWGLRAFSVAKIGSACVRILRSSDSTQQDINIAANGFINMSDPFLDGSTYSIMKLYDQTGNGFDMDVLVGSTRATLTPNDNGTLPCIRVGQAGADNRMSSTSGATVHTVPISVSTVWRRITAGNNANTVQFIAVGDNQMQLEMNLSPDTASLFNSSRFTMAATDGVTHSWHGLFNNPAASSILCIDGSNTVGNDGSTTGIFTPGIPYALFNTGNLYDSKFWEGGWWMSDISASFAALSANQHTAWNF